MEKVRFGKTGLMVSKVAFGGIPIQRLSTEEAVAVVRGVINLGVNFLDTANGYADSEEKIGLAIKGMPRDSLVITSKSTARDKKTILEHIDLSLSRLGVEYIDFYQLHNISSDEIYDAVFADGGAYEGLEEAIRAGKVRFAAFSSHSIPIGVRMIREGKFAVVQLPFNFIDEEAAEEAIPLAKEMDMGFIAMKPLGGGRFTDAKLSFKYLSQFESIVPDPGIEKLSEMEEIISIVESGEKLTAEDAAEIEIVKAKFGGSWCHRCEYCQPCPQNIKISSVLSTDTFIMRMTRKKVHEIVEDQIEAARGCTDCRACAARCPYELDIPELIREQLSLWDNYIREES